MNWSGFKLVGRDVEISLSEIRHAMLDQHLDRTEDAVNEILNQDLFNPQPNPPTGKKDFFVENNVNLFNAAAG